MGKLKPTVVFAVVAKLGAHVATLDARHEAMGVQVPNLNDEGQNAKVIFCTFIFNDKPCKNKGVISKSTHVSRPPFGCLEARCIYDKLISFHVKSGRCFETSHI